ncbi:MAG TPA: DUF58 domain-containing protein [Candidatus Limnocylindria bacterium]|nr:DUF58 domain-containing protein [Candidatus Limnocylindria bacterium]
MRAWLLLALAMAILGAALSAPGLLLVAGVTTIYGSLTRLWSRYGARRVEYCRRLGAGRAVAGDSMPLDVTIWNRKPLPLPWVAAEDLMSDGLTVRERPSLDRDNEVIGRRILHNAWSLAWYERVVRHFHLDDLRRGVYEFGPVRIRVRDILGRDAVDGRLELPATLVVSPRTLPVRRSGLELSPIGERRARTSLFTDPALYGGVRPFQPGDTLRHVHWRATARLGTPVIRRHEPARGRQVVLAIDVQTLPGAHWQMTWDESAFEAVCVTAASLARQLLDGGASVGVAAASFTGSPQRFAWLAPQATAAQLGRMGALLARMGPISSSPYGGLLTWLTRRLAPGGSVQLFSVRDPRTFLPAARRLGRGGYDVQLVAVGADARRHAVTARAAGLRAAAAELVPTPDHPDAIILAV